MYTIKDSTLGAIADSIRSKTGGTEAMTPEEMAAQIAGIETGGGGVDINAIADGSIGGELVIDEADTIQEYAFYRKTALELVIAPKVKTVGQYAFYYCAQLSGLELPSVETVGGYAFAYCLEIDTIDMPKAKSIGTYAFSNCAKLKTIILRAGSVATLANTTALYYTPFANSGTGGILYVPAALVDSYKAANRWSTILGYPNNQIRALEDYTVDGTVTGELDPNKI